MTWCDKLASTPSVGFKVEPHYMGLDTALRVLAPMVDQWVEGDKSTFEIVQQDAANFSLNEHGGFGYGIGPIKLSVDFKYRLRAKRVSAGPPTVQLTTPPRPFSDLLPDVAKRLIKMTTLLFADHSRRIERVGVTSTTIIDVNEAPPGVKRFLEYIGRPWRAELDEFNVILIAPLGKGRGWTERCIHTLGRGEGTDGLLQMLFDWQRLFETSRDATTEEALNSIMQDAQKGALAYFEDVAEGNRFDEKLLAAAGA